MPLLIGGATTSRQHTAVKIAPRVRAPDGARARRVARGGHGGVRCSTRSSAPSFDARTARSRRRCASCTADKRVKPMLPFAEAERQSRRASSGAPRICAQPAFLGRRTIEICRSRELVEYIDWTFFFTAWELERALPGRSSSTRSTARRRAICTTSATQLVVAHRRREALDRARGRTASGRRTRGQRHRALRRREPRARGGALHDAAPAAGEDGRRPAPVARRFRGAAPSGLGRSRRRVRRDRGARRRRAGEAATSGSSTTTARSSPRRWPTGSPRRSRRCCISARAREWGYGASETLTHERAHRREVSRHPPGVRLSGVPRPHRRSASSSRCSTRARRGMALTESCAMTPAASVSGLYFAHPQARYFNVGRSGAIRSWPTRRARA